VALSGRRLLIASVLVLLVPAALGVTALSHQRPDPPPADTGRIYEVLAQTPSAAARAALDRSRVANRVAGKLTLPTLLDPARTAGPDAAGLPTLALTGATSARALATVAVPARSRPYTLTELAGLLPAAFADLDGHTWRQGPLLVKANVVLSSGATLVIDGATPDVRLSSSAAGFAAIISRGTLTVSGQPTRPVRIGSWDPVQRQPDRRTSDGRAFVLDSGGRMDARHAVFTALGFDIGVTSGVAWSGSALGGTTTGPVKATGDVSDSSFLGNHFGAYTREATGMRWTGNTFAGNDEYGFDPHDFSDGFLVEGNNAYGNGKHGFILSRGCTDNVVRNNVAHDNAGHGFMIDDGRSTPTEDATTRIDGSNDNSVVGNDAFANGGSGIEIEGGTGNVVAGNRLMENYVGVRVKDDAAVTVRGNVLTANIRYGIDVRNVGGAVSLAGNTISRSWGAISMASAGSATLDGNLSSDVSADLVVGGTAIRDTPWIAHVSAFLYWNPLLLLWSLVLGVPVLVTMLRLVSGRSRAMRRRIPAR
jgi:parallel beta-helix repeat protein